VGSAPNSGRYSGSGHLPLPLRKEREDFGFVLHAAASDASKMESSATTFCDVS
jgi:hypothetical protein